MVGEQIGHIIYVSYWNITGETIHNKKIKNHKYWNKKHNEQNFKPIIWVLNEENLPYYHQQLDQTSWNRTKQVCVSEIKNVSEKIFCYGFEHLNNEYFFWCIVSHSILQKAVRNCFWPLRAVKRANAASLPVILGFLYFHLSFIITVIFLMSTFMNLFSYLPKHFRSYLLNC